MRCEKRTKDRQTDEICDAAVPFKLVPRKLARLGASRWVRDAACAAEDGPVEGEDPCPLDKLAEMGKEMKAEITSPRGHEAHFGWSLLPAEGGGG